MGLCLPLEAPLRQLFRCLAGECTQGKQEEARTFSTLRPPGGGGGRGQTYGASFESPGHDPFIPPAPNFPQGSPGSTAGGDAQGTQLQETMAALTGAVLSQVQANVGFTEAMAAMAKKEPGFDRTWEERGIFHTKHETNMRKLHESETDVEGWFIDWERFTAGHHSGRT